MGLAPPLRFVAVVETIATAAVANPGEPRPLYSAIVRE